MIKEEFDKSGFIKFSKFIKDENFYKLCENIDKEINLKFSENEKNLSKLGGSLMGNININTGIKGDLIWSFLKNNNIAKIIKDLINLDENEYEIFYGGNLLYHYPKSCNQLFHTDGTKHPRKIMVTLSLDDVNEENGPTEIYEGSHKTKLPYWKFIFKYYFKKKYQLNLKKGDIFIREAFIWHRGTKNKTNKNRILINFIISEKKNDLLDYKKKQEITFLDNMFDSNLRGKIKEFFNVKLTPLYFFYRLMRSFIN
jgi:integrase